VRLQRTDGGVDAAELLAPAPAGFEPTLRCEAAAD